MVPTNVTHAKCTLHNIGKLEASPRQARLSCTWACRVSNMPDSCQIPASQDVGLLGFTGLIGLEVAVQSGQQEYMSGSFLLSASPAVLPSAYTQMAVDGLCQGALRTCLTTLKIKISDASQLP